MDFIVKVGIDGYQFPVLLGDMRNLNPSINRFIMLQEQIALETKIDIKNQYLLTKKGTKIDDLSIFDNDPSFFQTNSFLEQKALDIFLFDLSDSYELQNHSYKFDIKMDLKQLILTEEAKEALSNLNPNILSYEKQFFSYLQNIKVKYIPFQQKVKFIEKQFQELENQIQSLDILIKQGSNQYNSTKQKITDIQRKIKDSDEIFSQIVKKFNESVEDLKNYELHPLFQQQNKTTLQDIYYSTEDMIKYRNQCLQNSQGLKQKIEKVKIETKDLKKKIKEERNSNIATCVSQYKQCQYQYSQYIQESKSLISSVVQSTIEEYNNLRQNMITFSQDCNDESSLFYVSQFEIGADQLKSFENTQQFLEQHYDKICKVCDALSKQKQITSNLLRNSFKTMKQIASDFESTNATIRKHGDAVTKMEKDFNYLLTPSQLPEAYKQTLLEISRRNEFCEIRDQKLKSLNALIEQETQKRRKFLGSYGRILPQDVFGFLKNMPQSIQLDKQQMESYLPKILNLHQDKYGNEQSILLQQIDYLKQQIEDLNLQCKQTHSYYQEKSDKKSSVYIDLLNMTAKNSMKMFIQKYDKKVLSQNDLNTERKENREQSKQDDSMNKQELEKYKQKYQKLENEQQQKQQDLDKKNQLINEQQQKYELLEQLVKQRDIQINKIREDLNKYMQKSENLEIQLVQKNNEIQKINQSTNKEKAQFIDQINQSKQQYQELLKKLQQYQLQCDQQQNEIRELEIQNQTYLQQVQEYCKTTQIIQNDLDKMKNQMMNLEIEKDNKQIELEKQITLYNQLLNEFVSKNEQLDSMGSDQQSFQNKEQDYKEQIKILQNKFDNLEIAYNQKNHEFQSKQQEHIEINIQIQDLQLQLQKFEESQDLYLNQIAILEGQIESLNNKQQSDNIVDIVQNKLILTDPQFIFDLSSVKIGQQCIFVPAQQGVYVPLILKNISNSSINEEMSTQSIEQSSISQKQYRVKNESLNQQYRDFIIETGLIFIATIQDINETEDVININVQQPSYIIGFEESDNNIKNFTI